MNGYERVVAAIQHREPDRVPIMEISIHEKVREGLCPGCDAFDLVEHLDLDGVGVSAGHFGGPGGAAPLDTAVGDVIVSEWGGRFMRTAEAYQPVGGPINSEADLKSFTPPDPYKKDLSETLGRAVDRFKGKRFIFFHCRAEFMAAADIHGLESLLINFMDNPDLAHGVLKTINDYYCVLARRAIEAGADAVSFGDDWAFNIGPFMSPTHFREFILPYFKKAVDTVKEAGGYVMKHCDGNIWSLMDMVADSGIDIINPIQPDAGMDIGEMKAKYGDRLCLAGNINCGYTLSEAPVEQVVQEVKEAIRKAGHGGGYIVMSSNSLHSSVRPQNYRAMVEATRQYGEYPLDMKALSG